MEDSVSPLEENDQPFGFSEEFIKCDITEVLQKCSQDPQGILSFYNQILRDRELDELLPHIKEIKELMQYTASHGDLYVREPFLNELKSIIGRYKGDREDVVADLIFDTLLVYIEDQNFELRDNAFRFMFEFLDSIRKNVEFIEQKIPAVLQFVRRSRRYCTKKLYLFAHKLFKVLAHMAYLVGPQKTEELILQPYLEFCMWPYRYSILFRRVSVMIFPTICYIMGTAYTEEKLLDHFANLCKDKSWMVRNTAATYIVHVSLMCTPEVRKTRMAQIVLDLTKDNNKTIVTTALLDLGKFISTLAVPCITGLVYTTGRANEIHFPNTYLEELHVISPTMDVFRRFASPELLDNYQYYADKYSLPGGCTNKKITTETTVETRPKSSLAPQQISERIASMRNRIFRHSDGFNYSLDSLEFTSTQSLFDLSKSLSEPVPYGKVGENSWIFPSTDASMQDTSSDMDSDAVAGSIVYNTGDYSAGGNRWIDGPSDYVICVNGRYRQTSCSSTSMTGESITSMFNKIQENINRSAINIDLDTMNEDICTEDEDDLPEFNSNWYWNSTTSDIPLDLGLIEKKRDKTETRIPEYMAIFEEHYAREMPFSYEQSVVPPEILKTFFASIAFEWKDNMKLVCASNIPAIAITLGSSNWHILRPFFRCLCDDIDSKVPKTIASYIAVLANLLGKDVARRDLVPVFIDFFKNHDDVKNEAILNLADFMKAIWFYKDELFLRVLVTLYQGSEVNWHIIKELAKKVYMLVQECNFITNLESFLYVTSFAAHLLEDKISFNRTLGSHVLAQTLRVCQHNEMEGILQFLETEYAMSDSFKRRQSYVHVLVNGNKNGAPRKELLRIVLPIVERLSVDHISNVRLVVARYLVKSIESGEVTSTLNSSEINIVVRMLKRLENDEDGVVRDLISQITESKLSEVFNIAGYLQDEESQEDQISSVAQEQNDEEEEVEAKEKEQEQEKEEVEVQDQKNDDVNADQSVPNERTSSTAVEEVAIKLKDAIVFESQL